MLRLRSKGRLILGLVWLLGGGDFGGVEILYAQASVEQLPEVVVTANKLEENPQDIPIPITVLNKQELVDRKVYRLEDLFQHLPNILNAPGILGERMINFRGFLADTFSKRSPVILVIDGMPVSKFRAFSVNFGTVEQIEFLRGAQNTLFGQSAIGGVINITSQKPTNEVRSHAEFFGGSRNSYRGEAYLSGPLLQDKLFMGIGYTHWRTDGFIRNTFHNDPASPSTHGDHLDYERRDQFHGDLAWYPTARYSARLFFNRDVRDNGQGRTAARGVIDDRVETVSHDIDGFSNYEVNSGTLGQTLETNWFDVVSTTGVNGFSWDQRWDNDFGSGDEVDGRPQLVDEDTITVTQELR